MAAASEAGVADFTYGALFSNYKRHSKVQARSVKGRYNTLRWAAVWFTQILYYGLPWLTWNDRQAVLFDLGARKFYLFGMVLWPQDFIWLAGLLVIAALALFFFTAVAGRLWCGYACPQTVYTEIFSWIEYKVEGDRNARIKLDSSPMSPQKFKTKAIKHALWILIAFWTGFTFIGYFAPIRELGSDLLHLSLGPWQWFWLVFYSFATWGNAGFMREQVCTYMCPYARFQGAMFDRDTLIVTYDDKRGEPRGSRSRKADRAQSSLGDCINCNLCVHVCPTGIDIRQGQQYECIGCAACIDVCNTVMDKMEYPRGLIRYSTARAMTERLDDRQILQRVLRPRTLVYGAILLALVIAFIGTLATRNPLKVDVIRDRGALARLDDVGNIENTYRLQLMNASESPITVKISAAGLDGLAISGTDRFEIPAASNRSVALKLSVPPAGNRPGTHAIELHVTTDPATDVQRDEKTVFIVPR